MAENGKEKGDIVFSGFQRQTTYFGTLDDVVDRYPWPQALDLRALRQQLVNSAIYGKQILINDGYLVANPMLVPDLGNINRSLTGALLSTGQARLFTREANVNLVAGIERTAAGSSGVTSHHQIMADSKNWPKLKSDLDYLSKLPALRDAAVIWPADKNMGHLFYKLMERIRGLEGADRAAIIPAGGNADFDAIYARFDKRMQEGRNGRHLITYDGARTVWEQEAWREYSKSKVIPQPHEIAAIRDVAERERRFPGYRKVQPMMNIANEAYHLAYSAAAAHSLSGADGARKEIIGVSSAMVSVFPDLVGSEAASGHGLDERRASEMNQLMLHVPGDIEFGGDFAFIRDIETDGTLRVTRDAYLSELDAYAAGRAEFSHALRVRDEYARAVANCMTGAVKRKRHWLAYEHLCDLLLEKPISAMSVVPGLGWLLSIGVTHLRGQIIERMLKQRLEVSLGEAGRLAASNGGTTPLVRQLGFYLGPMNGAGTAKFVAEVGPRPTE